MSTETKAPSKSQTTKKRRFSGTGGSGEVAPKLSKTNETGRKAREADDSEDAPNEDKAKTETETEAQTKTETKTKESKMPFKKRYYVVLKCMNDELEHEVHNQKESFTDEVSATLSACQVLETYLRGGFKGYADQVEELIAAATEACGKTRRVTLEKAEDRLSLLNRIVGELGGGRMHDTGYYATAHVDYIVL